MKAAGTPPGFIHGDDGLGNLSQRVKVAGTAESLSAAEYIVDMARKHPGEITIVAIVIMVSSGMYKVEVAIVVEVMEFSLQKESGILKTGAYSAICKESVAIVFIDLQCITMGSEKTVEISVVVEVGKIARP